MLDLIWVSSVLMVCSSLLFNLILAVPVVMAVERAKSLTGMVVLTRWTKGTVTRGRFTGTALGTGTGDRRPR